MYARYLLVSLHQQPGESVTEYAQTLKALAKECTFGAVAADEYRAELMREAFMNGLSSPFIRQRILDKGEFNLVQAVELADMFRPCAETSCDDGSGDRYDCRIGPFTLRSV